MKTKEEMIAMHVSGIDRSIQDYFEVETIDGYFERERIENMLAEGWEVPDDKLPQFKSQQEKDIWRRQGNMYRLETVRCHRVDIDEDDRPLDKTFLIMETSEDRYERLQRKFSRLED